MWSFKKESRLSRLCWSISWYFGCRFSSGYYHHDCLSSQGLRNSKRSQSQNSQNRTSTTYEAAFRYQITCHFPCSTLLLAIFVLRHCRQSTAQISTTTNPALKLRCAQVLVVSNSSDWFLYICRALLHSIAFPKDSFFMPVQHSLSLEFAITTSHSIDQRDSSSFFQAAIEIQGPWRFVFIDTFETPVSTFTID